MEYLDEEYTEFVNKSYSRQFSKNQYIAKIMPDYLCKKDTILDFGAGPDAFGAKYLNEWDVTAWDIGQNFVFGVHDPQAMDRKYSIIMCSNVLNIQPSEKDVDLVLILLSQLLHPGGKLICNFPKKPRHNGYSKSRLEMTLGVLFHPTIIKKDPLTWLCRKRSNLLFECDTCKKKFWMIDHGESLADCPFCGEESHYTEYYE